MPVYDQSYKHYEGTYKPPSFGWMTISEYGIRKIWRQKGIRFVLFIAFLPFVVFVTRLYFAANVESLRAFGFPDHIINDVIVVNSEMYMSYLMVQLFFCFLITLLVGASLIAQDRRNKAIALYLSKPISKLDYLFGKGAIVVAYLALITLIPALLLVLINAIFTDDFGYIFRSYPIIFDIISMSFIIILPMTLLIMMLSSLSKSTTSATVMFCIVYFFPRIIGGLYYSFAREERFSQKWVDLHSLISLDTIWVQLAHVIFGIQNAPYVLDATWYFTILLAVCLFSGLVCYSRIRPVEVVR